MLAKPNSDRRAPAAGVFCLCIASACASATAPPPVTPAAVTLSPDPAGELDPSEAAAIAAAKNHPIATSYERPRTVNALPVAPTRPESVSILNTQPVSAPQDQVILVGQDQAAPDGSITSYAGTTPVADPYPPNGSVATNTASSIQDQGYVWTDGAWVATTPGIAVYGPDIWIGYSPWAWGYGPYYHPYWPVAAPYPYYHHPHHHHHHHAYPHHVQPLPHRPPPARAGHAGQDNRANNGRDYGAPASPRDQGSYARRDMNENRSRPAARDRALPSAPAARRPGSYAATPSRSWSSGSRPSAPSAREAAFQSAPAARRAGMYASSPNQSWSSTPRRALPAPVSVDRGARRPSAHSAPPAATFNRASSSAWGGSFGGGRRSVQMSGGRR